MNLTFLVDITELESSLAVVMSVLGVYIMPV